MNIAFKQTKWHNDPNVHCTDLEQENGVPTTLYIMYVIAVLSVNLKLDYIN